ncbi:MAG: Hsp20/alpha crystallin family protein [Anaerolineaceae bacterium]|jgi:HSP20 family protein
MAIKDLIPRKQSDRMEIENRGDDPIFSLQRQMNRLFDDFFTNPFGLSTFGEFENRFFPRVDLLETDKEITVTADIPGMDEKDIDVSVANGVLAISGEKSSEKMDKSGTYHRMERSYGSFRRDIALPDDVEADKAEAVFSKGVLTITLPKPENAVNRTKKISVKKG